MSAIGWVVLAGLLGAAVGFLLAAALRRRRRRLGLAEEPEPVASPRDNQDFARLVRALPLGVIFVDASARIRFANPAAGTIFNFDATRAIGAHFIASIPNVELERRIEEAMRGEASVAPITIANGKRGAAPMWCRYIRSATTPRPKAWCSLPTIRPRSRDSNVPEKSS